MTVATEKVAASSGVDELVAEVDTGGRAPQGAVSREVLFFVPLAWTLFQLWYASPLPFVFNFFVLNDTGHIPPFPHLRVLPNVIFLCRTGFLR